MRHLVSVCLGLWLLSAVVGHAQRASPPRLRAGGAMADITPNQNDLAVATDFYSHLTFQVIGSRLKPGCAEGKIVATAITLMRDAGQ